jgi:hypothetical protein
MEFILLRLAFVGTSLANAYFADLAYKHHFKATFFESSEVGGAWSQSMLGNSITSRFNNVIFPYSKDQEEELGLLHDWLLTRGADIRMLGEGFSSISPYKPQNILAGNFAPAINIIVEDTSAVLLKKIVHRIDVHPSGVEVNGEHFDYAILPLNARVDLLTIHAKFGQKSTKLKLCWIESRSEHVRISFGMPLTGLAFAEHEDNVFDRYGVIPPTGKVFIGRVGHSWKGKPLTELLEESFATRGLLDDIEFADEQSFSQKRLEPSDALVLRELAAGSRLIVIDSSDAITGVRQAREYVKKISQKHRA